MAEGKDTYFIRYVGKKENHFQNFQTLSIYGKSLYPTAIWDLKDFPEIFNFKTYHGISDHTIGYEISLLAIARGAKTLKNTLL